MRAEVVALALLLSGCFAVRVPPALPEEPVPHELGPLFIRVDSAEPRAWTWATDLAQTLEADGLAPRIVTSEAALPARARVIAGVAPERPACEVTLLKVLVLYASVGLIPVRDCPAQGYRFELHEARASRGVEVHAGYRLRGWVGWICVLLVPRDDYVLELDWAPTHPGVRRRVRAALSDAAARL